MASELPVQRAPSVRRLPAARIYKPRWLLRFDVPLQGVKPGDGSAQTLDIVHFWVDATTGPKRVTVPSPTGATNDVVTFYCPAKSVDMVRNSHREANTLAAVTDWRYVGADPRLMSDAVVSAYIGQADPITGQWNPVDDDCRFVGIMKKCQRSASEGQGMQVEILAHDYTTLFLEAKTSQGGFDPTKVPLYTDTLSTAWRKVCDLVSYIDPNDPTHTFSRCEELKERIVFAGGATDALIGQAVPERLRSIGHVVTKPKMDCWALWQQCCAICGLITYFRNDTVIVTTATDYFTANNSPVLVWGDNVESVVEDRDVSLGHKGIHLQAFNPMTGTQIESFFPAIGDSAVRKKKVSAKRVNDVATVLDAEDRVSYAIKGVTDQVVLDSMAKSTYYEMATQELEGRLTTHEMVVDDETGIDFDLLQLEAGDTIKFVIKGQDLDALGQFKSDSSKTDYLIGLGYAPPLAKLWVANLNGVLSLAPIYLVKRVHISMDTDESGGSFQIEITYCNRIMADGDSPPTPEGAP